MYLVAIGWMYVVVMMAVAEALSPQGTLLGAFITLVFYGFLPVSILIYILGAPMRKRARQADERAQESALAAALPLDAGTQNPLPAAAQPDDRAATNAVADQPKP
jgi:hypothetical protein